MGKTENGSVGMKVLQFCYKMPYPLRDGGEYSIHNSAMSLLLQPATTVKTFALNTKKNWVDPETIPAPFRERTAFEWAEIDTRIKPLSLLKSLVLRRPYFANRFYSKAVSDRLISLLKREKYDVVQLEHLYLCQYLDDIRSVHAGKVILRSQNVEYEIWESYLKNVSNFAQKTYLKIETRKLKQFEREILSKLDGIITLSKQDKVSYERFTTQPIVSIPIGFDFDSAENLRTEKERNNPPLVYHLGSMDWLPNLQGINWFIAEVLPILRKLEPTIAIHLAGKKMPLEMNALSSNNLNIDGEIEDAIRYIEDKAILIVPLLSGGGIRVKIIEAMALGKSIVSTSLGAQGINCKHGESILIADTALEFATAIQQCYRSADLREKLGANARELSANEHGLCEVGKQTVAFYTPLIQLHNT